VLTGVEELSCSLTTRDKGSLCSGYPGDNEEKLEKEAVLPGETVDTSSESMPLSFSSILFSNSVAKCSNLKPDFFSLNSGLISLKLLLSPKINLSCSSLLEAKGKGGDSVR